MYGKQEDDSDEWKYVEKLDGNWTHWYENGQKFQLNYRLTVIIMSIHLPT